MWSSFYNKLVAVLLLMFGSNAYALTANFTPQAWDYIFYTFALCGVVFAALIILAYKEYQWLFYVLLSLLLLVHSSAVDGSLAYFLATHTELDNADFILWVVPYLLTTAVASYGFWIIALQIKPPHFLALLKTVFFTLSGISALLAASTVFWLGKLSLAEMWLPANILFLTMVVCQFLPPLTWTSYSVKLRLLIRAYPFVVAAVAVGGYVYLLSSPSSSQVDFNHLYRIVLLLVAFFSLSIVVWQAFNNKQSKELAERKAIEAARNEAEMQLALIESEQAYQQALDTAARHQNQLATVSHDLKQPIIALRLAAEKLAKEQQADAEKLSLAVDYIDSLSHSYTDHEVEEQQMTVADNLEPISTSMLMAALSKMFESDAQQKQIEIRFYSPAYQVLVEPLSTMRVMTNLISNAIKHADASRIVVGFRRKGDKVIFQVHDNGLGIAEAMQATLFVSGIKGETSQGDGLGLAIVKELCEAHNMPFELRSEHNIGTSIYVAMPFLKNNVGETE